MMLSGLVCTGGNQESVFPLQDCLYLSARGASVPRVMVKERSLPSSGLSSGTAPTSTMNWFRSARTMVTVSRIGCWFPSNAVLNISYTATRPSGGSLKKSASVAFGARTVTQSR